MVGCVKYVNGQRMNGFDSAKVTHSQTGAAVLKVVFNLANADDALFMITVYNYLIFMIIRI